MKTLPFAAAAGLAAGLALTASIAASPAAAASRTAVFAGGCFWSVEKFFEATPGVTNAVSGYSGGATSNPTYQNHRGHLEVVRVTYDPDKISYAKLVETFYRNIDPTDPRGQFCDKGEAYKTAVFVSNAAERQVAEAEKARVARLLGAPVTVATRDAAPFWTAEREHQDFARRNPAHYERYRVGCRRDERLRAVWAGR